MPRLKEKRRMEAAIKNGSKPELQWAFSYCQMRLDLAKKLGQKSHLKHWQQEIDRVEAKMNEAAC